LDDASHIYEPTLSSFQTLFPLLRPGGLYIIEDWAWEHWPECHGAEYPLAHARGLSELVGELVQAVGTSEKFIKNVTAYEGFVVVERGNSAMPPHFQLKDNIVRRPERKAQRVTVNSLKQAIRKVF
jgi:hypothetical protein